MATYQSSYTGAQIDQAVGAALTPPDKSLSLTGMAADAKAVGDSLATKVQTGKKLADHNLYKNPTVEAGKYYKSDGTKGSNSAFQIDTCDLDASYQGKWLYGIWNCLGGSVNCVVFLDSNNDFISGASSSGNLITSSGNRFETRVLVPSTAVKMCVSRYTDAYCASLSIDPHIYISNQASLFTGTDRSNSFYRFDGADTNALSDYRVDRLNSIFGYKIMVGTSLLNVPTFTRIRINASGNFELNSTSPHVTFPISIADLKTIRLTLASAFSKWYYFLDENGDIIANSNGTDTVIDVGSLPATYKYVCFFYTSDSTYQAPANITLFNKSADYDAFNDQVKDGAFSQYNGLSGVAFGTSLTYRAQTTGGYLQYLPKLSGLTIDNQGVGSSYIYGASGDYNMLETIKGYSSYSGKDVVLLEGFVNDWYNEHTLGTYTDATETSVCGCVRSAINYIRTQNADATIYLILDHYGRNANSADCSSTAVKGGKTQFEYYEEIAKVAKSLGVRVIKLYEDSEMSESTPQYYIDNIHPNAKGAKQTANAIWSKIKIWMPNVK